jgi:protein tyrosine/serine phosphatase
VDIPEEKIVNALVAVLDERNLPLLIHCNKGTVIYVFRER